MQQSDQWLLEELSLKQIEVHILSQANPGSRPILLYTMTREAQRNMKKENPIFHFFLVAEDMLQQLVLEQWGCNMNIHVSLKEY